MAKMKAAVLGNTGDLVDVQVVVNPYLIDTSADAAANPQLVSHLVLDGVFTLRLYDPVGTLVAPTAVTPEGYVVPGKEFVQLFPGETEMMVPHNLISPEDLHRTLGGIDYGVKALGYNAAIDERAVGISGAFDLSILYNNPGFNFNLFKNIKTDTVR